MHIIVRDADKLRAKPIDAIKLVRGLFDLELRPAKEIIDKLRMLDTGGHETFDLGGVTPEVLDRIYLARARANHVGIEIMAIPISSEAFHELYYDELKSILSKSYLAQHSHISYTINKLISAYLPPEEIK